MPQTKIRDTHAKAAIESVKIWMGVPVLAMIPSDDVLAGLGVPDAVTARGAAGARYFAQWQQAQAQVQFAPVLTDGALEGSFLGGTGFGSFEAADVAARSSEAWMNQQYEQIVLPIDLSRMRRVAGPGWMDSASRTWEDDFAGLGKSIINLPGNLYQATFSPFGGADASGIRMSVSADEQRGYALGNYSLAAAGVAVPVLRAGYRSAVQNYAIDVAGNPFLAEQALSVGNSIPSVVLNRQAVADMGIPVQMSPRQAMHVPPVTDGRSVLTADAATLLDGLQAGQFTVLRQPKPGQVVVDFGKPIGEYWTRQSGAPVFVGPTNYGSVMYGKHGAHVVPTNPKQW